MYMGFGMKCGSILAVPMMIEIFQERVKMVSAGSCKQNRSVTIVGTLCMQSVSRPRCLPCSLTIRSLGEFREQTCGETGMANLQQPNDLRAGLAAPEGHYVTANRFVQKGTLVLISLQAHAAVRNPVVSTTYIHARWARLSRSIDFRRPTERDLRWSHGVHCDGV